MAIASIQETLFLYSQQKADLTSRLATISARLTLAASQSMELTKNETAEKRELARRITSGELTADSTEYQVAVAEIEDEYELELAEINHWEQQLEVEKEQLETQIKQVTSYEESYTAILKSNVQKDFKYAQS